MMSDIIRVSQRESNEHYYKGLNMSEAETLLKKLNSNNTNGNKNVVWSIKSINEEHTFSGLNSQNNDFVKLEKDAKYMLVAESPKLYEDFNTRTISIMGDNKGNFSIFNSTIKKDTLTGTTNVVPGGMLGIEFKNTDMIGNDGMYFYNIDGKRKMSTMMMYKKDGKTMSLDYNNENKLTSMINKLATETMYTTGGMNKTAIGNLKSVIRENHYAESGKMISDYFLSSKVSTYLDLSGSKFRDSTVDDIIGGSLSIIDKLTFNKVDETKNIFLSGENEEVAKSIEEFLTGRKKISNSDLHSFLNDLDVSHYEIKYSGKTASGITLIDKNNKRIELNPKAFDNFKGFINNRTDSVFKYSNEASELSNLIGHGESGNVFSSLNVAMSLGTIEERQTTVSSIIDDSAEKILSNVHLDSKNIDDKLNEIKAIVRDKRKSFYNKELNNSYDEFVNNIFEQTGQKREDSKDIENYINNKLKGTEIDINMDKIKKSNLEIIDNALVGFKKKIADTYKPGEYEYYYEKVKKLYELKQHINFRVENGETFHTMGYIGKQSSVKSGKLTTVDAKMMHMLGYLNAQGQRYDQGADLISDAVEDGENINKVINDSILGGSEMNYKKSIYKRNYKEGNEFLDYIKEQSGVSEASYFEKQAMVLYADSNYAYQDSNTFSKMTALSNIGSHNDKTIKIDYSSLTDSALNLIKTEIGEDTFDNFVHGRINNVEEIQEIQNSILKTLIGEKNLSKLKSKDFNKELEALGNKVFKENFDLSTTSGQLSYSKAVEEYENKLNHLFNKNFLKSNPEATTSIFRDGVLHSEGLGIISGGNFVNLKDFEFTENGLELKVSSMMMQNEGSKVQVGDIKATTGAVKNLIMFNGRNVDGIVNSNMFNSKRGFTGTFLSSSLHTMYYHAANNNKTDEWQNIMKNINVEYNGKTINALDVLGLSIDVNKGGINFSDKNVAKALEVLKTGDTRDYMINNPFHSLHNSFANNIKNLFGVAIDDKASSYIARQITTNLYKGYEDFLENEGIGDKGRILFSNGGNLISNNFDNTSMETIEEIKGASYLFLNPLHIMNESRKFKDEEALKIGRLATSVLTEQGSSEIADIFDDLIVQNSKEDYNTMKLLFGVSGNRDGAEFKSIFNSTLDLSKVDDVNTSSNKISDWLINNPLGKIKENGNRIFKFNKKNSTVDGSARILMENLDDELKRSFGRITGSFSEYENKMLAGPMMKAITDFSYTDEASNIIKSDFLSFFSETDIKKSLIRDMRKKASLFINNSDTTPWIFGDGKINGNYASYIEDMKSFYSKNDISNSAEIYKKAKIYSLLQENDGSIYEKSLYKSTKKRNILEQVDELFYDQEKFNKFFGNNINFIVEDYDKELGKFTGSEIKAFIGIQLEKQKQIQKIFEEGSLFEESHMKLGSQVMDFRGSIAKILYKSGQLSEEELLKYAVSGIDIDDLKKINIFTNESTYGDLMKMSKAIANADINIDDKEALETLFAIGRNFYKGNEDNIFEVIQLGKFGNVPLQIKNLAIDEHGGRVYNSAMNNADEIIESSHKINTLSRTINNITHAEMISEKQTNGIISKIDNIIETTGSKNLPSELENKRIEYFSNLKKIKKYIEANKTRISLSLEDFNNLSIKEKASIIKRANNVSANKLVEESFNSTSILKNKKTGLKGMEKYRNLKNGTIIAVYDLETNGTDAKKAEIASVAALKYVYNDGEFTQLDGEAGRLERYYDVNKVNKGAEGVHGLTAEAIENNRQRINQNSTRTFVGNDFEIKSGTKTGIRELEDFFDDVDIIAGYNHKDYDMNVLKNNGISENILGKELLDVIDLTTENYGDNDIFSNGKIKIQLEHSARILGVPFSETEAHGAMYDTEKTFEVLKEIFKRDESILSNGNFSNEEIFGIIDKLTERKNTLKGKGYTKEYQEVSDQLNEINKILNETYAKTSANIGGVNKLLNNIETNSTILDSSEETKVISDILNNEGEKLSISAKDMNNIKTRTEIALSNARKTLANAVTGRSHTIGDLFNTKGYVENMSTVTFKNSKSLTPKDGSGLITSATNMIENISTPEEIAEFKKGVKLVWGDGHEKIIDGAFNSSDSQGKLKLKKYLEDLMGIAIGNKEGFDHPAESLSEDGRAYVYSSRHPVQYKNSMLASEIVLLDENQRNTSFLKNFFSNNDEMLNNNNSIYFVGKKSSAALNMDFDGDRMQMLFITDELGDKGTIDLIKSDIELTHSLNNMLSTETNLGLNASEKSEVYETIKRKYKKNISTSNLNDNLKAKMLKVADEKIENKKYFLQMDMVRINQGYSSEVKKHSEIIDLLGADNLTKTKIDKIINAKTQEERKLLMKNILLADTDYNFLDDIEKETNEIIKNAKIVDEKKKKYIELKKKINVFKEAKDVELKNTASIELSDQIGEFLTTEEGSIKFNNMHLSQNLFTSYAGQSRTGTVHDALSQYREASQRMVQDNSFEQIKESLLLLSKKNGTDKEVNNSLETMEKIRKLSAKTLGFNNFTDVIEGVISAKLGGKDGENISNRVVQLYETLRKNSANNIVEKSIDFEKMHQLINSLRENMNDEVKLEEVLKELIGGEKLTLNSLVNSIFKNGSIGEGADLFKNLRKVLSFEILGEYHYDDRNYDFSKDLSKAVNIDGKEVQIGSSTLLRGFSNALAGMTTGTIDSTITEASGYNKRWRNLNSVKHVYNEVFGEGKNAITSMMTLTKEKFLGLRGNIFNFSKMNESEEIDEVEKNVSGTKIKENTGEEISNRLKEEEIKTAEVKKIIDSENEARKIHEGEAKTINKTIQAETKLEQEIADDTNIKKASGTINRLKEAIGNKKIKTSYIKWGVGALTVLAIARGISNSSSDVVELDIDDQQFDNDPNHLKRKLGNYNININNRRSFY